MARTAGWMPRDLAQIVQRAGRHGGGAVEFRAELAELGRHRGPLPRAAAAPGVTSGPWAPSCRSCSIRRRAWSAAATIRARNAVTSARASAFATAVAASSVNPASRASVPAGSGARLDAMLTMPHSRPSTLTGTPTTVRTPSSSRAGSATGPVASPKSSMRAGWPVWNTSDPVLCPPGPNRVPNGTGTAAPVLAQVATSVSAPSGSYRLMPVVSASSSCPASTVTAANTSSGGAARATSVATRRSAACSSANLRSSACACAFAIAVAASSTGTSSARTTTGCR